MWAYEEEQREDIDECGYKDISRVRVALFFRHVNM